MATANVVPPMLTPKNPQESEKEKEKETKSPDVNSETTSKVKLTKEKLKKLFGKIDLSGIRDWSEEDQKEVKKINQELWFSICLKWLRFRQNVYCEK